MQYKNIIFDLGNVLVSLDLEGCIGAFKALGMGELVNMAVPNSKGRELMSKLSIYIKRRELELCNMKGECHKLKTLPLYTLY